MSFGFEIILLLLTAGGLLLLHLVQAVMRQRIPEELRFEAIELSHPPEALAELFAAADQELQSCGFEDPCWGAVRVKPPLIGSVPPLIRIYRHHSAPIIARVSPPVGLLAGDRCLIALFSLHQGQQRLFVTGPRIPELFPRMPESEAILLCEEYSGVAAQVAAHQALMQRQPDHWLHWPNDEQRHAWLLDLLSRYEYRSLHWMREQGHIKPHPDGGMNASLRIAFRFIGQLVTARLPKPPSEQQQLPPAQAAYLFRNWWHSSNLPIPPRWQQGLFLLSTLLFTVAAGLLWSWTLALLLLVVILLHEAGHWAAMRALGYRDLQLLMLPLVGGVTSGREQRPIAANRALVSLLGPLPGILLGWLLLLLVGTLGSESGHHLLLFAILLLAINYLNLLPIMPLDGGQLLRTLIPPQRIHLLAGLELLAVPALLALGWLLHSTLLALLAIIPLLAGLSTLKRRRILERLYHTPACDQAASELEQLEAVIRCLDEEQQPYRPLVQKAQEIDTLWHLVRTKPAQPATLVLLLSLYLASFALPLLFFAPTLNTWVSDWRGGSDYPMIDQESFYAQARVLSMEDLLTTLMKEKEKDFARYQPRPMGEILRPPASAAALSAAEQRLGFALPLDYRDFLALSNGLMDEWEPEQFWLLPVEQIAPLAHYDPELLTTLQEVATALGAEGAKGLWLEDRSTREPPQTRLPLHQLHTMVVIGGTLMLGEYLLMTPPGEREEIHFLHSGNHFSATLHPTFHTLLADHLASLWVESAYLRRLEVTE